MGPSAGCRPCGATRATVQHQELTSMPREKIILACGECKNRNYFTAKNKRLHPERVEWKKYCPRCDKHQVHKATKSWPATSHDHRRGRRPRPPAIGGRVWSLSITASLPRC